MAGRGVHFSLSDAEIAVLRRLEGRARIDHLFETIETDYFENHADRFVESDKAWDAMHRALTDGRLELADVGYPLTHVILGGQDLGSDDHLMILKTPQEVRDVAAALPAITKASFRTRYDAIDPGSYEMTPSDEDFEYTWTYFDDVRTFWHRAAEEGRSILFSVGL